MPSKNSVGAMYHSVAFDKPGSISDGAGGVSGGWDEQFICRASYIHLRGGEGVQGSRLEGRHPQVITVRSFAASRLVDTNWRARDVHTGDIFNIRDVTPTEDRKIIEILCEKGVAV